MATTDAPPPTVPLATAVALVQRAVAAAVCTVVDASAARMVASAADDDVVGAALAGVAARPGSHVSLAVVDAVVNVAIGAALPRLGGATPLKAVAARAAARAVLHPPPAAGGASLRAVIAQAAAAAALHASPPPACGGRGARPSPTPSREQSLTAAGAVVLPAMPPSASPWKQLAPSNLVRRFSFVVSHDVGALVGWRPSTSAISDSTPVDVSAGVPPRVYRCKLQRQAARGPRAYGEMRLACRDLLVAAGARPGDWVCLESAAAARARGVAVAGRVEVVVHFARGPGA